MVGFHVASGIAVDWISGNLFYSTYTDTEWMISVARLDGAFRTIIAKFGMGGMPYQQPNALAVDPVQG